MTRKRRSFSTEFKQEAAILVLEARCQRLEQEKDILKKLPLS